MYDGGWGVCWAFQQGSCSRPNCRFRHVEEPVGAAAAADKDLPDLSECGVAARVFINEKPYLLTCYGVVNVHVLFAKGYSLLDASGTQVDLNEVGVVLLSGVCVPCPCPCVCLTTSPVQAYETFLSRWGVWS